MDFLSLPWNIKCLILNKFPKKDLDSLASASKTTEEMVDNFEEFTSRPLFSDFPWLVS